MAKQKGAPKTGGRVAGIKNKLTQGLELRVDVICQQVGVNPFEILARLSKDPEPAIAIQATKELCKYLKPQLRAIEISENPDKYIGKAQEEARLAALREKVKASLNERKQS